MPLFRTLPFNPLRRAPSAPAAVIAPIPVYAQIDVATALSAAAWAMHTGASPNEALRWRVVKALSDAVGLWYGDKTVNAAAFRHLLLQAKQGLRQLGTAGPVQTVAGIVDAVLQSTT